ncbi:MAG: ATP-dependent helicase [Planctomycetes bacterium]|nr:ATP-dependent helicase [Planctomycetota bacterium]
MASIDKDAYEKSFAELDERQREAVLARERIVRVIAAPGSGKTRTLALRFIDLVLRGVPADRILVLTFSRKAAEEMEARISKFITGTTPELHVSTFHSFAFKVLRENPHVFGSKASIISSALEKELLALAMENLRAELPAEWFARKRLAFDFPEAKISQIQELITLLKQNLVKADALSKAISQDRGAGFEGRASLESARHLALIAREYESLLERAGMLDFRDLILRFIDFLEMEESRYVREKFAHVIVDEFQDTDPSQFEMIAKLTSGKCSLYVVGDPRQSIYRFRGARPENIVARGREKSFLEKRFGREKVRTIELGKSRRFGLAIAKAANAVAEGFFTGEAISSVEPEIENSVRVIGGANERECAKAACECIAREILIDRVKAEEICVIARTHEQLSALKDELDDAGIECRASEEPSRSPAASRIEAALELVKAGHFVRLAEKNYEVEEILEGCAKRLEKLLPSRLIRELESGARFEGASTTAYARKLCARLRADFPDKYREGPLTKDVVPGLRDPVYSRLEPADEERIDLVIGLIERGGEISSGFEDFASKLLCLVHDSSDPCRIKKLSQASEIDNSEPSNETSERFCGRGRPRSHVPTIVSKCRLPLAANAAGDQEPADKLLEVARWFDRFSALGADERKDVTQGEMAGRFLQAFDTMKTETKMKSDNLSLLTQRGRPSPGSDGDGAGVNLYTAHAAKGLEFDSVYVLNLNEGLFPLGGRTESKMRADVSRLLEKKLGKRDGGGFRAIGAEEHGLEEQRLAFVSMTRARKRLTLCFQNAEASPAPAEVLVRVANALGIDLASAGAPPAFPTVKRNVESLILRLNPADREALRIEVETRRPDIQDAAAELWKSKVASLFREPATIRDQLEKDGLGPLNDLGFRDCETIYTCPRKFFYERFFERYFESRDRSAREANLYEDTLKPGNYFIRPLLAELAKPHHQKKLKADPEGWISKAASDYLRDKYGIETVRGEESGGDKAIAALERLRSDLIETLRIHVSALRSEGVEFAEEDVAIARIGAMAVHGRILSATKDDARYAFGFQARKKPSQKTAAKNLLADALKEKGGSPRVADVLRALAEDLDGVIESWGEHKPDRDQSKEAGISRLSNSAKLDDSGVKKMRDDHGASPEDLEALRKLLHERIRIVTEEGLFPADPREGSSRTCLESSWSPADSGGCPYERFCRPDDRRATSR